MKPPFSRKRLLDLFGLCLISAIWFGIGWLVHARQTSPEARLFEQARQRLADAYPATRPDERTLTYAAIRGMIDSLNDPYAALLEPDLAARLADDAAGRTGSLGLVVDRQGDQWVAAYLYPGSAAESAGVAVGDVILSVDGTPLTARTSLAEAALRVRGPLGSTAHLEVQRGPQALSFDPVRGERPSLSAHLLENGVLYIQQIAFTTDAPAQMRQALQEFLPQQPVGIVWDLRRNGGGSMPAAQEILSQFIAGGALFSLQTKDGSETFSALPGGLATDLPIVVLVGDHTYSAAETSALALRERRAALLVGGPTYGKGIVQATAMLGDGATLQLTLARWLSPAGVWLDGTGITPDLAVRDDPTTPADEVLDAAIRQLP